jgi:aminopeptidase YwaD
MSLEIYPSPFTKPYEGAGELAVIQTLKELAAADCCGRILLLYGDISKEPLMPKDFPFYYPEEHKQIIDLLEEKKPLAVIAVTGKHPMCGLEPYPMFEDGNFAVPSAFISRSKADTLLGKDKNVKLHIVSEVKASKGGQIIAAMKTKGKALGKIVLCAHMDTKYGTSGALDNASGVAVLMEVMDRLKNWPGNYDLEFVPFNSEEYYEVSGEMAYGGYMQASAVPVKLAVNIDGACHKDSKTAVSCYNFDDMLNKRLTEKVEENDNVVEGMPWYAGDHAMFAYGGIPCMAVTSSNLEDGVMDLTHTENDTFDKVSCHLINETADFLAGCIRSFS